jgi:hypothetical protein
MNRHSWWLSYRDLNLRCTSKCLFERLAAFVSGSKHHAYTMVLSMLVAIIAAPGLLGSQEAIRQSQSQEKREEHRARRCNLIATCVKSSIRSREINGRPVVLKNGKLWIDTGTDDGQPFGHPYAGYYLPYPDSQHEGLVTTVTDIAPIMNWVYIDKETHEVKYGVRLDAQPNLTGPFDCTRQDRRLTFDGWEGFCAVEEVPGFWSLYFDVNDDGLQSKIAPGTKVLELELSRKEKRFQKEHSARQHDQTTKRAIDAREEAPVDQPLAPEALVSKPGVIDETPLAQEEQPKPKPFRIPKSIFENPPPVLQSSVFERPLTPPPAYTTTDVAESPTTSDPVTIALDAGTRPLSRAQQIVNTAQSIIDTSAKTSQAQDAPPRPRLKSPSPSKIPRSRSTSPLDVISNPVGEKRTTPKLNRSSGTRALAQAQMFEAMAAERRPKIEVQIGSTRRVSRTSSNGDSGPQYSRGSQEVDEEGFEAGLRIPPSVSPTPAPLVTKAKGPQKRAEAQAVQKSDAPMEAARRPRTPTRQRALTGPRDPAVFGAQSRPSTKPREPARASKTSMTSPLRSQTLRSSSQASNNLPSAKPLPSRSLSQVSIKSPRPSSQRRGTAAEQSGSPRAPMQRRNTASSPRAPLQSNRAAAQSSSLASTMTSGKGNRSMTARVSGAGERGRATTIHSGSRAAVGRKTTSALFREIDELVSQDVGGQEE